MFLCLDPKPKQMKVYYVSTLPKPSGHHEVHADKCIYLPGFLNRKFLGHFHSPVAAIREAQKHYPKANACHECLSSQRVDVK
jgi:hypothetical protein